MTRTAAREIAIHCAYSLGFSRQSAEELLQERLDRARFLQWGRRIPFTGNTPTRSSCNTSKMWFAAWLNTARNWTSTLHSTQRIGTLRASHCPPLPSCVWRCTKSSYRPDIPAAASINDAVEIAKKYEDEKIVSFINGILGAFVRAEFPDTLTKPAPEEA